MLLKRNTELDWQFLAETDPEAPWPPELTATQTGLRVRRMVVFAITMAFLLTAGIGTIYAHNEAQKGIAEVEEGVEAAVDAEAWVQEHAPELSAELLIDDAASDDVSWMAASEHHLLAAIAQQEAPRSELQVTGTRFRGSNAAAEVQVTLPASQGRAELVFRQTRFYRETPQGWLRTQPLPALWGPSHSIETERLVWRYRQRDEQVVLAIAEDMDALYAQLLADYGLAQALRAEKLIVDVRVDFLPGKLMLQENPATLVTVPSPAVFLLPEQYSDADVLAQAVGLALLESLRYQAAVAYPMGWAYAVSEGLRLWELKEMGLGLSTSTWDASLRRREKEDLHTICATYAVWMLRPMAAGVPVLCEAARAESLSYRIEYLVKHSFDDIGWRYADFSTDRGSGWVIPQGASVIMTTVIDYAVSVYGRGSLPSLLMTLGEHQNWDTLIPAVYGLPFEEFEAGWQAHVAHLAE